MTIDLIGPRARQYRLEGKYRRRSMSGISFDINPLSQKCPIQQLELRVRYCKWRSHRGAPHVQIRRLHGEIQPQGQIERWNTGRCGRTRAGRAT